VIFEGPYGAFRAEAREHRAVVLLAAGIGVTSVCSLLEDLGVDSRPVVVLRASQRHELALLDEIEELTSKRGGRLVELIGARAKHSVDAALLRRLVPDLKSREAYVCGPSAFVADCTAALLDADVPRRAIHHEAYALW
jgi:ferredoxin-NADP reductase